MIPIHLFALALLPLQESAKPQAQPATLQVQKAPALKSAEDLLGLQVQNGQGKTLGEVREVLLHPHGDVAFLVLSAAGWLDLGERMIPVPYAAFSFEPETGVVALPVEPEHFKKAPGYPGSAAPEFDNMDWFAEASNHFKHQRKLSSGVREASASTMQKAKRYQPVSELKTRKLESPQGEQLGTLHAIVIDQQAARVAFAVIATGGNLGTGQKLVAVPWSAIQVAPDDDNPKFERLTLATTAERLAQAPEFKAPANEREPLADPAWLLTVYQFHAVQPYWTTTVGTDDHKEE